MSPDGQTIVTGAGDETLRFWNAFELERGKKIGTGTARADGDILMGGFGKAQTKGDVMGSMLTLR
jgi:cell division cycle 20-like protein 1 (cofactor of APC complex)